MAHGRLKSLGRGSVQVGSAGTQPKGVHPLSIQVMSEVGIDLSSPLPATLISTWTTSWSLRF